MYDDFNFDELDPGIRETVRFLRKHGFETVDSGDGVSKVGTELEDAMLDFPHVAMLTTPYTMVEESERLYSLLKAQGVQFGPNGVVSVDPNNPPSDPHIDVSYSPVDGHAILMLSFVDDQSLKQGKEQRC
jgi:hypothetical protein